MWNVSSSQKEKYKEESCFLDFSHIWQNLIQWNKTKQKNQYYLFFLKNFDLSTTGSYPVNLVFSIRFMKME